MVLLYDFEGAKAFLIADAAGNVSWDFYNLNAIYWKCRLLVRRTMAKASIPLCTHLSTREKYYDLQIPENGGHYGQDGGNAGRHELRRFVISVRR